MPAGWYNIYFVMRAIDLNVWLFSGLVIAQVMLGPIVCIWSINMIFHSDIAYSVVNWFCMQLIFFINQSSIKIKHK